MTRAVFSVSALSRGRGVPPEAREALARVRKLVEDDRARGVRVRSETTRIGIEGEARLCVEYDDVQEGMKALARVRALVKDVDLVNVVTEACADGATLPGGPPQEEKKP